MLARNTAWPSLGWRISLGTGSRTRTTRPTPFPASGATLAWPVTNIVTSTPAAYRPAAVSVVAIAMPLGESAKS